jgi:hypothetical protein
MQTKTRSMLFAVVIASGPAVAAAEPSSSSSLSVTAVTVHAPRPLATGQPACGNVIYKTVESPACPTLRTIRTVIEEARALGHDLPWFRVPGRPGAGSLTVAPEARPRS